MKRYKWLIVGVSVVVLVIAGVVIYRDLLGIRSIPNTRLATRTLNAQPSTAPSAGEDWPRFRGPRGDAISREAALNEKWPGDGPRQLWAADVGIGYSSPVATQGRVYLFSLVGDKDTLAAFDAESGQILWSVSDPAGFTDGYPGSRATPTIENDRIYTYSGAGHLTARELSSGKLIWQINVLRETGSDNIQWGMTSSPAILGNLVIVQSGEGGSIALAVNKSDGTPAWKSQAAGKGGYAQIVPIEVDGKTQLAVFAGKALLGIDPENGKTLWQEEWVTSYDINAAAPIYRDGHLFVSSAYGHGCMMLKLSASGATRLWENENIQTRFQGAILENNHLYANSEGTLLCMSWPDGRIVWSQKKPEFRLGIGGSLTRFGEDRMLLMSERGKMSIAKVTPEGVELIAQAQVLDAREAWSTPLIYGGRVYAKGTQELICFDLR